MNYKFAARWKSCRAAEECKMIVLFGNELYFTDRNSKALITMKVLNLACGKREAFRAPLHEIPRLLCAKPAVLTGLCASS